MFWRRRWKFDNYSIKSTEMINNKYMSHSLKNIYTKQVLLKENDVKPKDLEVSDSSKSLDVLSTSMKKIIGMIDSPTDKLEELLEYIREEAMTAMIDSGVEKD